MPSSLSTDEVRARAQQVRAESVKWKRGRRRWTTETFVEASTFIHGGFYSYGKTQYVRTTDKATITCPEHGDFEQVVTTHLDGHGCPDCSCVKSKQTNLERYGVENPMQSPKIQEKTKQTNLERYGVEYLGQSSEIRDKAKQTNLERYGTEYPIQSPEIRNKVKQTNLERYGVEYLGQSSEIRDKAKQTNLERYGTEYPTQSSEIQSKVKQTNLERYGVECSMQSFAVRKKSKRTMLERYGVENPAQSREIQEKMRRTNLKRYGAENPLQSPEIQNKARQTNLERYGVENPLQSAELMKHAHEHAVQTNRERYGADCFMQSVAYQRRVPEIQAKIQATKEANGTFNSSSIEDDFIARTGFIPQYRDEERYPFACDAYDPETDTFIEINAHWTHGGHWFDPNDPDDAATFAVWRAKAETSKFYTRAIEVWTHRDVEKRECARTHNLNYVVLWNQSDVERWLAAGAPVRHDWR